MSRRWLFGSVAAILVSSIPGVAVGQSLDLGQTLERAARDVARDALDGEEAPGPAAQGAAQPYTVKTPDGWTLVAHRFLPRGKPLDGAAPVILCHGLTYNAAFWNLDPSCSLVDYLTGKGYDVWAVDLRGCGFSSKWVFKLDSAPEVILGDAMRKLSRGKLGATGFASVDPKFSKWSLDHHIAYDVPAFVQLVKRETKAEDVTWIGHSMGGIIALAHLARVGNPGIGRLITVGSQVTMPRGELAEQFLGELIQTRTQQVAGSLTAAQLAGQTKTSVHNLFFNTDNVLPAVYEALGSTAVDVPALGLMQQYQTLSSTGELLDVKQKFHYAQALGKITIPILVSCGAADAFAPPAVQKYLYDHVGSTDKTLIDFGKSMGFSVDAGHDDALVGKNSKAQVYPKIEAWIRGARPKTK
jgi:pimeloyl-ACP methyl ester carboxylesterase